MSARKMTFPIADSIIHGQRPKETETKNNHPFTFFSVSRGKRSARSARWLTILINFILLYLIYCSSSNVLCLWGGAKTKATVHHRPLSKCAHIAPSPQSVILHWFISHLTVHLCFRYKIQAISSAMTAIMSEEIRFFLCSIQPDIYCFYFNLFM